MQLTKDKVATINYTLKNKDGEVMDESSDGSFAYLHGARNIIPGLENALEGKEAGDKTNVVIEPKDAYGERSLEQIQRVPLSMFPDDAEIKEGMQFEAASPEGAPVLVTVTAIDGGEVVVDGNHPMAGIELHFDVELVEVRDASEEELEHGHVHGPNGHHH
ncbi:MAG: peptidylprolyl isomerase [Proteobacteria bacterium]|nr:peptidylprolyl isomerase [Pseudomonadota bacterium]NOG59994.1 peptidylprolyl isomerase [Pseudomonadota bacterium]